MNDLTRWLCEFGSRQRLLNTFTVKLTKHTVNSFESIRSRWCLVTEDGFSSDISPPGTVTPYRLSHILDWLVNRSAAAAVCVYVWLHNSGKFRLDFCVLLNKNAVKFSRFRLCPLTSHWLLCFNGQTCCSALTTGLPLAVKLMLPVFKYFFLLILGGLRQAVSIPSHFVSQERILLVFFFVVVVSVKSITVFYVHSDSHQFYSCKMWPVLCVWGKKNVCLVCLHMNNDFLFLIF